MVRFPVFLGASFLILAPITPHIGSQFAAQWALQTQMAHFARSGITFTDARFDPQHHRVTLQDVAFTRDGVTLHIDHLDLRLTESPNVSAFGLIETAAAQAPAPVTGTLSADNVAIDTADLHVAIDHIHMDGTTLSRADLDALLDPKSTIPIVERLQKVSASHAAIPRIVISTKPSGQPKGGQPDTSKANGGHDTTVTLRDVAIDNLAQGHAGLIIIGSSGAVFHSPDAEEAQAGFGLIRVKGLDLVLLAKIIAGTPALDAAPASLCEKLGIDGGRIVSANAKAELGIESLMIADIKTRPTPAPTSKDPAAELPSPPPSTAARIFSTIDIGAAEMSDLHFATINDPPWRGKIGHVSMQHVAATRIAQASFDAIAIAGPQAALQIGHIGWQGLNWGMATQLLGYGAPKTTVPILGLQNIAIDAIDLNLTAAAQSPKPETPTHFRVAHVEVATRAPANDLPTRIAAQIDHFTSDLQNINARSPEFAALGYNAVDLSSRLQLHFDNDYTELGLDTFSFSGASMGAVHLSGFVDHLSKALMSPGSNEAKNALLNVLLRHVDLRVENTGLFERLIAAESKRTHATPDDIRQKIIQNVATELPKLLGQGRDSDLILAALTKFIKDPKNLRLSILAPQGLGAFDAGLFKDPETLQQKIDVEVVAND